ncbi:MAG TPA: hypothetical protein VGD81_14335 [Opitutaceae bacterium]
MSPSEVAASSYSLTDAQGQERAKLCLVDQAPTLFFYDTHHHPRLQLGLTGDGLPRIFLHGLPAAVPTVKLECDALGSHVLLSGGGRAQSYLFLKNEGGSGLVLFGADGQRQIEVLLAADGSARWTLWDPAGNVIASSNATPA